MRDAENKAYSTLGARIKTIIREQGIMQKDFAASLGVSANYVYLITSDKKTSISETLALLIESIYGYPVHWILTGENNKFISYPKNLKQNIMEKIKTMDSAELKAVAAFIRSFEEIRN